MPVVLQEELSTAGGAILQLRSADPRIVGHWQAPGSYATLLLKQINEDRIYAPILRGRKDLTVLDLGANIGLFTLHVSDIARTVIAVEPTPAHFHILKALTQGRDNIRCLNVAASHSDADVTFYLHTRNTTANSLQRYDPNSAAITVRGMTIPMILDAAGVEHVDFCKLDIEGSEEFVLTDATLEQSKARVDSCYMEVHPTGRGGYAENMRDFMALFARHGYFARQVTEDGFLASKTAFAM